MQRRVRQLVGYAVLIEGGLLGIAMVWIYVQNIPWRRALTPSILFSCTGIGAGILLFSVNYVVVEYGSRYFSFFRAIKHLIENDVSPLFKDIPLGAVVLIAIVSGVAEEMFFRGVLQVQIGVLFSSILFGLAHVWKTTAIVYGVYAAIIGTYFGGLYAWTGNLWVPIIAHIINNFVAILYYLQTTTTKSEQRTMSEEVS